MAAEIWWLTLARTRRQRRSMAPKMRATTAISATRASYAASSRSLTRAHEKAARALKTARIAVETRSRTLAQAVTRQRATKTIMTRSSPWRKTWKNGRWTTKCKSISATNAISRRALRLRSIFELFGSTFKSTLFLEQIRCAAFLNDQF